MQNDKLTVEMIKDETPEECFIKLGGDTSDPTWEEFTANMYPDWQERFNVLRTFIETNKMVGMCGDEQEDYYFKFSDGEMISFSMRAWGDLMQAIVGKREGYMRYYMKGFADNEE